ncbi:MAG: DUF2793 domain-containing protein, partial [Pseudomonadota bacterium]
MEQSPRLSLSYLAPQQAQKHVTVNESLRTLDALVQLAVRSVQTSEEPAAPSEGDAYILPSGQSGAAWGAMPDGGVAVFQDGAWTAYAPAEGLRAYVIDENLLYVRANGAWSAITGAAGDSAPRFGVNADADAANRLFVKSDGVVFS